MKSGGIPISFKLEQKRLVDASVSQSFYFHLALLSTQNRRPEPPDVYLRFSHPTASPSPSPSPSP